MKAALSLFCAAVLCALPSYAADDPPAQAAVADAPTEAFDAHMKAGRAFFQDRRYAQALQEFAAAIELKPQHHDARLFGGLSAYWNLQPEMALDCWNPLLDAAKRNSNEEWEIERHRVMALSALGASDAVDAVVERLYELRRGKKSPAALAAKGFVREHFYFGNLRVGAWEVFDERDEMPELWTFPVTVILPPGKAPGAKPNSTPDAEPLAKRLSVESTLLPGGGAGYLLAEYGPGYRRVYKRWTQKPAYAEVRALVLQSMKKPLPFLDESPQDNRSEFPAGAAAKPDPKTTPVPDSAVSTSPPVAPVAPVAPVTSAPQPAAVKPAEHAADAAPEQSADTRQRDREKELAHEAALLGYDPDVTRMLTLVAELRDIKFDVTRAARLSLTDPGLANRQIQELNAAAPGAQENAAELVDLVSKAKALQVQNVFREAAKMKERSSYLDFALLTAMNTRGRDYSETLLIEDLKHPDFMVRQTTALLLARMGDPRGPAQLFEELKSADAAGCSILSVALEEVIGTVLGAAPQLGIEQSDALARKWRENAEKWWHANRAKLEFKRDAPADGPCWAPK